MEAGDQAGSTDDCLGADGIRSGGDCAVLEPIIWDLASHTYLEVLNILILFKNNFIRLDSNPNLSIVKKVLYPKVHLSALLLYLC